MKHQMILLSADLRQVYARLSARFNASEAQADERRIRTPEDAGSRPVTSPR
jgi:hypothetical protein